MYRLLRRGALNKSRPSFFPKTFSRKYVSRNHIVETQGIDTYVHLNKGLVEYHRPKEEYKEEDSIEKDLKNIIFSKIPFATIRSVGEKELKGRELKLWNTEIDRLERRLELLAIEIAQDLRTDILPDTNKSLRFPDWPTAINFLLNSCVYHQSQERTYYLRSKLFKEKFQINQEEFKKTGALFDEIDQKIADDEMERGFTYLRPDVIPELEPEMRRLTLKEITKAEMMKFADKWFILRGNQDIKFLLNQKATELENVLKKTPELRNIVMNYVKYVTDVAPPLRNIDEMIEAISHYSGDGYFKTIKGVNIIFMYHFINIHNLLESTGNKQMKQEVIELMKNFGLYPEKGVKYRYLRKLFGEKPKFTFSLEEKKNIRKHFKNILDNTGNMSREMIFHVKELIRIVKEGKIGDDTLTIVDDTLNTDSLPETSDDWRMNCERIALAWDIITKNEKVKVHDYAENRAEYLITTRLLVHLDEIAASGEFGKLRRTIQKAGLYENELLRDFIDRTNEMAERQIEILRLKHSQKIPPKYDVIDVEGHRQFLYESPTEGIYLANLSLFEESYRLSRAIQSHQFPVPNSNAPVYDIDDVLEYFGIDEDEKSYKSMRDARNKPYEPIGRPKHPSEKYTDQSELKPESIFSDDFLNYIAPKVTIDESDILNEIDSLDIDPLPILGLNWKIAKSNELGLHHWSDFTSKTGLNKDVLKPFVIRILDDTFEYNNVAFRVERVLMIDFQEGNVILSEIQKERRLTKEYSNFLKNLIQMSPEERLSKSGDTARVKDFNEALSDHPALFQLSLLEQAHEMRESKNPLEQLDDIPLSRQRMFKIPHNLLLSLKKVLYPTSQDDLPSDEFFRINEENKKHVDEKKISERHLEEIEQKNLLAKKIMEIMNAE